MNEHVIDFLDVHELEGMRADADALHNDANLVVSVTYKRFTGTVVDPGTGTETPTYVTTSSLNAIQIPVGVFLRQAGAEFIAESEYVFSIESDELPDNDDLTLEDRILTSGSVEYEVVAFQRAWDNRIILVFAKRR